MVLYQYTSETGELIEKTVLRPTIDIGNQGYGYQVLLSGDFLFVPVSAVIGGGAVYVYNIADLENPIELGHLVIGVEPGNWSSTFGIRSCIHDDFIVLANWGRNYWSVDYAGAFHIMRENVTSCRGDFDNNGVRDVKDLLMLLKNWQTDGAGADILPPYDIVDASDLSGFYNYWGLCQWGRD